MPGFDEAFEFLMKWEGGYVNDPTDPGGETNFGISKRAYPDVDIRALTKEKAKKIYKRDYWRVVRAHDLLTYKLCLTLFDFAVNSGTDRAIKALQNALGVKEDGIFGPMTMKELLRTNGTVADRERMLADKINDKRLEFYVRLTNITPASRRFLLGWLRRLFALQKAIS
jgi:lysozyme family protein